MSPVEVVQTILSAGVGVVQMYWQEVEPLAPGMTNLQIERCLKGYPAIVCCADELSLHMGVKPHMFACRNMQLIRGIYNFR
jgi:hypothetical protein